jgi:hypothetical protein
MLDFTFLMGLEITFLNLITIPKNLENNHQFWVRPPSRSFSVAGSNTTDLNGVVVSVADCYPKGAGFDSRVMLGFFPFRKRGLRTLV